MRNFIPQSLCLLGILTPALLCSNPVNARAQSDYRIQVSKYVEEAGHTVMHDLPPVDPSAKIPAYNITLGDKLHLKVAKGTAEVEAGAKIGWDMLTDDQIVRYYKSIDDTHAFLLARILGDTNTTAPPEVDLVPYRAGTQKVSVSIKLGTEVLDPPMAEFIVAKPVIQAAPVEAGKKLGVGQELQYKALLTNGTNEIKLWNHDGNDTTKLVLRTPRITVTVPEDRRDFAFLRSGAGPGMEHKPEIDIGSGDTFVIGGMKHAEALNLKLMSNDGADPLSLTVEQVSYALQVSPQELALLDTQAQPVTVVVLADTKPVTGLADRVGVEPKSMDMLPFTVTKRSDNDATFDVKAKSSAATGKFNVVAGDLGAGPVPVTVGVKLDASRIQVSLADGTAMVLGSTSRLTYKVLSNDGTEPANITGADVAIEFDPKDQKVVSVITDRNDPSGKTLVIRAIGRGTTQLLLKYLRKADGVTVTGSINISVSVVAGFQPIRVAIDLMNQKMVHDLFGTETARDFFVAKVRLFNNITNQNAPDHLGDSILAYSESIEVGVELLKRDRNTGFWAPLTPEEIKVPFTPAHANLENPPGGDVTRFRPGTGFGGLVPQTDQFTSFAVMKRGSVDRFRIPVTSRGFDPIKYVWRVDPRNIIAQVDAPYGDSFRANTIGHATIRVSNKETGAQYNTVVLVYDVLDGLTVNQPPNPLSPGEQFEVQIKKDGKPIPTDGLKLTASPDAVVEVIKGTLAVRAKATGFANVHVEGMINGKLETIADLTIAVSSPLQRAVDPPAVFLEGSRLVRYKHRFRYRPYAFDIVVNTIDEREEGSSTARFFKVLDTGAQFGAFLAAIGRLGKFENIVFGQVGTSLLPSLQKLFPSKKETHRQNFVSFTMRQIEEIPFGSDVMRVIFFPKGVIHGMVADTDVRIGEIDTSYFNITAAIINKGTTTTTNAAGGTDTGPGNNQPNDNNGG